MTLFVEDRLQLSTVCRASVEDEGNVARVSLNIGKSITAPLSLRAHEQVRAAVAAAAVRWGAFTIAGHAKYLGNWLGPTWGMRLWDDVFQKMQDRA